MESGQTHSVVSLRGVERSYREGDQTRTVLRGVDLDIQPGEWVALVGRSGCGKSTLLNLISGIDRPDHGDIWLDGVNIARLSERERTLFRRRHIGFVYQFFNLIPTLTVEENLLLPIELNRLDQTRARKLLAAVGLEERHAAFPDRLSGGEQQRVAIARALAHDPLLLLADEPTGNLDRKTGEQMLQLMESLARTNRRALLIVTHSYEVARRTDRVLTLENGRIANEDTVTD
ncbi:MAG: ABC transporter ATP-binding protein [Gammaproteobacteria bacterium]|nr:ABC transporter ATP-binding protein [Gammaproteobacteria bacterium]